MEETKNQKYKLEVVRGGSLDNNCYVISSVSAGAAAFIDPGFGQSSLLSKADEYPGGVKMIINTHGHFDHIALNETLKKATGATVFIHQADADMFKMAGSQTFKARYARSFDRFLLGNEVLGLADLQLKIIHTPGHSPGGICILCDNLLFTGDTLFRLDVGRCDLEGGNYEQLLSSIREKLFVLPESTVVLPGHGESSTIGFELANNPYLR